MPSAEHPSTVLVVDDDPLVRAALRAALEAHGHRAVTAASPAEAGPDPDAEAVVLDAVIPGCSLSESLSALGHRADGSARPILVMSGAPTPPGELAGTGIGYLPKPATFAAFVGAVDALLGSAPREGRREAGIRST